MALVNLGGVDESTVEYRERPTETDRENLETIVEEYFETLTKWELDFIHSIDLQMRWSKKQGSIFDEIVNRKLNQ